MANFYHRQSPRPAHPRPVSVPHLHKEGPLNGQKAHYMDSYSVGVARRGANEGELEAIVSITGSEYQTLREALGRLRDLEPAFNFRLVDRNYRNLREVETFVTEVFKLGPRVATPDPRELGLSLFSSVVNFLTAMRLYLDHEEAQVKRSFGHASEQVRQFTAATAKAFDARPGYRFCYKLRNFVQHCGVPPLRLDGTNEFDGEVVTARTADVLLGRDALLQDYEAWGAHVRRDLQEMPEFFGLLPLAAGAMDGLVAVHSVCQELRLQHALQLVPHLSQAVEQLADHLVGDATPVLLKIQRASPDSPTLNVDPGYLPADAIRLLQQVADGERSIDSVWRTASTEQAVETSSTHLPGAERALVVIRETIAADRVGSDRVAAAANRIAAEDNDVAPLLSGLANVSALLVNMLARSIGASPESVVANLLAGEAVGPERRERQ